MLGNYHPLYEGQTMMSKYVVLCEAMPEGDVVCEAENEEWEDRDGTYWFTCTTCGCWNEVVYKWY